MEHEFLIGTSQLETSDHKLTISEISFLFFARSRENWSILLLYLPTKFRNFWLNVEREWWGLRSMETIWIFAFYKNIYKPCRDIVRKDSERKREPFKEPMTPRSLHVCCIRESTISRIILFLETAFQTQFTRYYKFWSPVLYTWSVCSAIVYWKGIVLTVIWLSCFPWRGRAMTPCPHGPLAAFARRLHDRKPSLKGQD